MHLLAETVGNDSSSFRHELNFALRENYCPAWKKQELPVGRR